ncbi:pyridoxal phosphate-dependent transferase [Aspergillus aurantiobrunneus]
MEQQMTPSNRAQANLQALHAFGFQPEQDGKQSQPPSEPPIDLSIAENWSIRPELVSLFQDAIQTSLTPEHLSYSNSHLGDTKTLSALSSFFNKHFNPRREVKQSHIALGPGSSNCLAGLLRQICDPGDGVLVPAPFWNGFDFHFAIAAQVAPVIAPLHLQDAYHEDALIASLTATFDRKPLRTRALVLTNPGNPIGQCYTKNTLRRCAKFCQDRALHLIVDEVYALSYFGGTTETGKSAPFRSILELDVAELGCDPARVHMVWSLSKDFGCSGLRLGCNVSQSNPRLIMALRLPAATEVSSLTTLCTTALLSAPTLPYLIAVNKKRLAESYNAVIKLLESHNLQYIPVTAGLFVFARLVSGATREDEARFEKRVKEEGLRISPGRAYHISEMGWYRLTFALGPRQLKRALVGLDRCLKT